MENIINRYINLKETELIKDVIILIFKYYKMLIKCEAMTMLTQILDDFYSKNTYQSKAFSMLNNYKRCLNNESCLSFLSYNYKLKKIMIEAWKRNLGDIKYYVIYDINLSDIVDEKQNKKDIDYVTSKINII